MLFVTSSLSFTGGSTFILRFCKFSNDKGKRQGVLILHDDSNEELLKELMNVADVYFLNDYIEKIPSFLKKIRYFSLFVGTNNKLKELFFSYESVHVLGVVGLTFLILKIKEYDIELNVTTAIYHQNEYMYQGVDSYFSKKAIDVFKVISPKKVIFFNDGNKRSYTEYFNKDFSQSAIAPIGVYIRKRKNWITNKRNRIVSIGNLYPFKTYNLNVVKILPDLLNIAPEIEFHIYGEGELKDEVLMLAEKLGISDSVIIHGQINYVKFDETVSNALAFIGSGTSILEAAANGVPSIIGIESMEEPMTYGFISEVVGFTYNEQHEKNSLVSILELLENLIESEGYRKCKADECYLKAQEFNISITYEKFEKQSFEKEMLSSYLPEIKNINSKKVLLSFAYMAIKDVLGIDKTFSTRRNQGSF